MGLEKEWRMEKERDGKMDRKEEEEMERGLF